MAKGVYIIERGVGRMCEERRRLLTSPSWLRTEIQA